MTMMMLEQLVSMGFPDSLAAEALKAAGGDILKATDWILSRTTQTITPPPTSHHHPTTDTPTASQPPQINHDYNPPPPLSPPAAAAASSNFQPKIDRFFYFRSKTHFQTSAVSSSSSKSQLCKEQQPHEHADEDDLDDDDDHQSQGRKRPRSSSSSQEPYNTSKRQPSSYSSPFRMVAPPSEPLSERMRPSTLDQVIGQDHLLGPNSALRSAIQHSRLPSILLWGPPGTGKTSIARAIVSSCSDIYRFVSLSAVNSGVKEVRDAVDEARKLKKTRGTTKIAHIERRTRTVLFIDEVHRFNKAQQDSLLPVIEDGSIVFIGATTENPSFHLITPLLSRCTVLVLNPLKPHHIAALLKRAVSDSDKGLNSSSSFKFEVEDEAIQFLAAHCDGDARVALNKLELSATTAAAEHFQLKKGGGGGEVSDSDLFLITLSHVKEAMQSKHIAYDRDGEEHYNLISALHKSMRGSDADASIYWLARMLEGGEQPLYIARRLIRFASEDVGLADPSALTQAVACYQACHFIGMPECNVNLAQCVAYLALAPKSISVYQAIQDAQKVVRESIGQNEGVPLHLRNAPTKLMQDIGYGKGYVYPPDNPDASQTYMPPSLQGYKFLHWPNAPGTA